MTTDPAPDWCTCEPGGHFEFHGQTYPAYIALCERHAEQSDAYQAGRRYEYDKVHGDGAFDALQQNDAYT